MLPEQITGAFSETRDAAEIVGDNPPTCHEMRNLGGAMLRENGWTLKEVRALTSHASEAMTQH